MLVFGSGSVSQTGKFSQPYTSMEEGTKNNSADANQSKLF
jgi:hypothetical protein